jgi:hypothetical protein
MTGNGAAADSPAADPHAPQQDGRGSRSMLLAKGCLWVLVQSLQANASPRFYKIAACTASRAMAGRASPGVSLSGWTCF